MNELQVGLNIALPEGTIVGEPREFFASMSEPNDMFVQCYPMDIRGCDVQILRYDYDDSCVIVFIGNKAKRMHRNEVEDYLREYFK